MKPRSAVLALFLALLCAMLSPMAPAQAASAYDDLVEIGQPIAKIHKFGHDAESDVGTNIGIYWQEAIDDGDTICEHHLNQYQQVLASPNPTYGELQILHQGTDDWTAVQLFWIDSSAYPSTLTFQTQDFGDQFVGAYGTGYNAIEVSYDYYGNFSVECFGGGLFMAARRSVAFDAITTKPIFYTGDVVYPAGYEGERIPRTSSTYVAMGDSFSSGEGNPPFEGVSGANGCHRSSAAYPYLLESELSKVNFVACSGATTDDVINGRNGEPSQLNALSADTEVVTISVGGNDIKFKEYATACVSANPLVSCDESSGEYQDSWMILTNSEHEDYLPNKLQDLFEEMSAHLTSGNLDTEVWVVGYPHVVTGLSFLGDSVVEPSCWYLSLGEAMAAEALVDKLNEVISSVVNDYKYSQDLRFNFVDPNAVPALFEGHELCTNDPYMRGIDAAAAPSGNINYVFHPNTEGHIAYSDTIAAAIVLANN